MPKTLTKKYNIDRKTFKILQIYLKKNYFLKNMYNAIVALKTRRVNSMTSMNNYNLLKLMMNSNTVFNLVLSDFK